MKAAFPHLKIGGPSLCGRLDWGKDFLAEMSRRQVPLDFFSWHTYTRFPEEPVKNTRRVRELLDMFGYTETESILNEWNYISGWLPIEKFIASLKAEKGLKGASFVAAVMLALQKEPLDMLMYYDARPATGWNGLFVTHTYELLPPYYAFWQFNKLYQLENEVFSKTDSRDLYVGAAAKDGKAAVQLVYYSDEEPAEETVALQFKGYIGPVRITQLLTDADHENETVQETICSGDETTLYIKMKLHSTMLLRVEPAEC